jgi:hypothetical protein
MLSQSSMSFGHGIEVTLLNKVVDTTYPRDWFVFGTRSMKLENVVDGHSFAQQDAPPE